MIFQVKRKFVQSSKFPQLPDRKSSFLKYGFDTIPYRASQLWQQVPIDIRKATSLALLKSSIKALKCEDSPCISSKVSIQNVEYISLGPISN